jgi:5-methylcytosine-specific restriction endonuclease McrA
MASNKKIRFPSTATRTAYERNRKKILANVDICAICGGPVDKTLKAPDPWSPVVDHIIPVSKGGDPAGEDNLQLAHRKCNREKSDKLPSASVKQKEKDVDPKEWLRWAEEKDKSDKAAGREKPGTRTEGKPRTKS